MSFLGQHFYTDAGIVLPDKTEINKDQCGSVRLLQENLSNLNINDNINSQIQLHNELSTVSVENVDIENMSDEDLKELETSTTNITDDIKVNLQKINKSKSMSKLSTENVKKRNKRYSWLLPSEQSNLPIPTSLKRRSLNINPGEGSKIPVSFRPKVHELLSHESKTERNISVVSKKNENLTCNPSRLKPPSKRMSFYKPVDTKDDNEKTATVKCHISDNKENLTKNEVKENIPLVSIMINVPTKNGILAKTSGLPILSR